MRKCNIALIVLDTLRKDAADGLDRLAPLGFKRVSDAFAPSVWTLPSHVSMFTGQLPSGHGVHESFGTYTNDLMQVSRDALRGSGENLLRYLRELGYATYGASANPMVAPSFGFDFDHFSWFDHAGRVDEHRLHRLFLTQNETARLKVVELIRDGELGFLAARGVQSAIDSIRARVKSRRLEKGSRFVAEHVREMTPAEPFFLFVNLVEAHEPYWWGSTGDEVVDGILGRKIDPAPWARAYPSHAALAVSRATEIARTLLRFDPLMIVCSDHGQLLGEKGRLGHVCFLEDQLVKVPLYVRLPSGAVPLEERKMPCSLAEIPGLVRSVVEGRQASLGSEYVMCESFGSHVNLVPHAAPGEREKLKSIYHSRVKVFSGSGSVLFDRDTQEADPSSGLSKEEVREHLAQVPDVKAPSRGGGGVYSEEETSLLTARLRDLGYE